MASHNGFNMTERIHEYYKDHNKEQKENHWKTNYSISKQTKKDDTVL